MSDQTRSSAPRSRTARLLTQVLWPAFLGAAATVGVVFSIIDPLEIESVHTALGGSRNAAYSLGFFGFWALFTLACWLTWLLVTTEHR